MKVYELMGTLEKMPAGSNIIVSIVTPDKQFHHAMISDCVTNPNGETAIITEYISSDEG